MLIPLIALTTLPFALSIPTPALHARSPSSSSSSPTPTFTPPIITLPTVSPNPNIDSEPYRNLTSKLQSVLQNAIQISNTTWEIGTLTDSLLEAYNPSLTPFEWDEGSFNGDVPWPMFSVALDALKLYNWTGSPNSSPDPSQLADYLDPATAPTRLVPQPLVVIEAPLGKGALGDPNSLGPAVWVVARFAEREDVREQYGLREAGDYAWAVGNQLEYTRNGNTSANGTISQREGYFEVWADEAGVLPPFPAYLGLATYNSSLLDFGLAQWTLESSACIDKTVNLYRHINDFDAYFWATGHGWMLYGIMRILKSIESAGQNDQFWTKIESVKAEIISVFESVFAQQDDQGLIPNYMLENNGPLYETGDASGTAAIVAAYYRFLAYCPGQVNDSLTAKASWAFNAVVDRIDSNGYLTQVVDPIGTNGNVIHVNETVRSPEAQSFVGWMWAARTAAGC